MEIRRQRPGAPRPGRLGDGEREGLRGQFRGDGIVDGAMFSQLGGQGSYCGNVNRSLNPQGRFVRALLGARHKPTASSRRHAELYVQSLGEYRPEQSLGPLTGPRYGRGEWWLASKFYAALGGRYEVTALFHLARARVANLTDGSMLMMPRLSWSIAQDTSPRDSFMMGAGDAPNQSPTHPSCCAFTVSSGGCRAWSSSPSRSFLEPAGRSPTRVTSTPLLPARPLLFFQRKSLPR